MKSGNNTKEKSSEDCNTANLHPAEPQKKVARSKLHHIGGRATSLLKSKSFQTIAFTSMLIAATFPILDSFFIYPKFSLQLTKEAERDAIFVATHMVTMTGLEEIELVHGALSDEDLGHIKTLEREFNLTELKIFSARGEIIYSTDPKEVGKINDKRYFHEIVAKGKTLAQVVQKQTRSLEGQIPTADVVETYIPIMRSGTFVGALKIYYDITEKREALDALISRSRYLLLMVALGLIVVIITISLKRAEAEENLRERSEFISNTLESLAHPFYVIDADDYTIKLANTAALAQIGPLSENLTCHAATHKRNTPCNDSEHLCPLDEVKNAKKSVAVEHIHYDKDGKPRCFEVHGHPIFDDEGNVVQMIEYSLDITERKQAEEEVRRQAKVLEVLNRETNRFVSEEDEKETFSRLLDGLLELTESEFGFIGEVFFTPEGKPYVKDRAITNIAWDQASRELIEAAPEGLEFYNPETLFGHVMTGKEVVISNDPGNDPRSGGTPPGHPELRSFMGVPFFHGGELVGMAGVANRPGGYDAEGAAFLEPFNSTCTVIIDAIRKRRERKQAEEELRKAHEELKGAYDTLERAQATAIAQEKLAAVGRLTAGVAHEVLNPLSVITMQLHMMLQGPDKPGEIVGDLQTMQEQANRIVKIAQDLLSFARQRSPERRQLDFNETVKGTLSLLERELKLSNIAVDMVLAEDLPTVWADQNQLQQVVFNLLTNARDVMPDGGRLVLRTSEAEPLFMGDEKSVELRVEDTGPGIAPENMDKLFEPFFTTKPTGKGTGLGLSICHGIVESHGGTIWAENLPEGGAAFVVRIGVEEE